MLEILALIFGSRKIGLLAESKNEPASKWKIIFVISWFAAEFFGAFIGLLFLKDIFPALIIGLGCAISVYLLITNYLNKMPNNFLNDIDTLGNN